jgi:hypothetical protein
VEAEPAVVRGTAEKSDEGFVEGVCRAKHRVNKCEANAAPLVVGVHAERAEAQGRDSVDVSAGADHVPEDFIVFTNCDK